MMLKPSRALLVVVVLLGLAMVLPDRHGVSTLAETNTGVRVWAVQSWVHHDTWSLDEVLCRLHPDYTPLDLSVRDGSPELQKAPGLSWLAVPVYGSSPRYEVGIAFRPTVRPRLWRSFACGYLWW